MNGKGDHRRPSQVPDAEVEAKWKRIFNKSEDDLHARVVEEHDFDLDFAMEGD